MYSPNPEFNLDGTSHTTVSAVPVTRNSRVFPTSPTYHHRQSSFGTASIAMSPPHAGARPIPFGDPNAQNWFGTSLDSNGSSYGHAHSPIFGGGRDLLVSPSTSTGQLDGFSGPDQDDDTQQRSLQDIVEKRRRRRESHNAVERRRRDNINERIHELCTLLPEHMLEAAPASSNVMSVTGGPAGVANKPVNKGTILKLSVDHIKDLKEQLTQYQKRVRDLEGMITQFKQDGTLPTKMDSDPIQSTNLQKGNGRPGHERVGSLQFQQQFGNLHIGNQ